MLERLKGLFILKKSFAVETQKTTIYLQSVVSEVPVYCDCHHSCQNIRHILIELQFI